MGTKKKFTPEELKHLQANPYTLRVTADSISYPLAFKEAFWALSLQGYTGTAAFRKLGYNTEALGFERIHNTTNQGLGGLLSLGKDEVGGSNPPSSSKKTQNQ